jgi:proteasome lid subunit RPN8/RPN11
MSEPTRFLLQSIQLESIKRHIDAHPTVEVCGLIGGVWQPYDTLAIAHAVTPIENIDAQPHVRFTMNPKQQLHTLLQYEDQGWEMVGIYHSHPQGSAKPSPSDIAESHYPDAVYLIGVPQGEFTAWRIVKGVAYAVVLEMV